MIKEVSRLRMFAGPNGSGKSTLKSMVRPELLGLYINPDEIEKELREHSFFDLNNYGLTLTEKEIVDFFKDSSLVKEANLFNNTQKLFLNRGKLSFSNISINAYLASVIADLSLLYSNRRSFY